MDARRTPLSMLAVVAAAVLQLLVLLPFTVASGLLAPLWAVVVFHVVWLAGVALLVRTARRRPLAAPAVPVGNALLLWLALTAGDLFLGWTA